MSGVLARTRRLCAAALYEKEENQGARNVNNYFAMMMLMTIMAGTAPNAAPSILATCMKRKRAPR